MAKSVVEYRLLRVEVGAIYQRVPGSRFRFGMIDGRLVFFEGEILKWLDSAPGVRVEELAKSA